MRVLINATSVSGGGGRAVASGLLRALGEGHPDDCYTVLVEQTSDLGDWEWPKNVQFEEVGWVVRSPVTRIFWEQISLPRYARRHDVLLGLAGFGVVFARMPQVVVSQNVHYFDRPTWLPLATRVKSRIQLAMFKMGIRRGAQCIAVSNYLAKLVLQTRSAPSSALHVVLNAPDSVPLAPTLQRGDCVPQDPSALKIAWVGSDAPHKNLREFQEAVPLLRRRLKDVDFVVIGAMESGNGRGFPRADPPIRYLGRVTTQDVRTELASCDLILVTSRLEAGPLVPLEAARLRIPIVASDIPAHGETLDPASLYRLGDVSSLTDKVVAMLSDTSARAQCVETNYLASLSRSWPHAAAEYRRIMHKAVSRSD